MKKGHRPVTRFIDEAHERATILGGRETRLSEGRHKASAVTIAADSVELMIPSPSESQESGNGVPSRWTNSDFPPPAMTVFKSSPG